MIQGCIKLKVDHGGDSSQSHGQAKSGDLSLIRCSGLCQVEAGSWEKSEPSRTWKHHC